MCRRRGINSKYDYDILSYIYSFHISKDSVSLPSMANKLIK